LNCSSVVEYESSLSSVSSESLVDVEEEEEEEEDDDDDELDDELLDDELLISSMNSMTISELSKLIARGVKKAEVDEGVDESLDDDEDDDEDDDDEDDDDEDHFEYELACVPNTAPPLIRNVASVKLVDDDEDDDDEDESEELEDVSVCSLLGRPQSIVSPCNICTT